MELKILEHKDFGEIRTTTDEKGNILFCASDVAKALGYKNANDAIARHCRGIVKHDSPIGGKMQEINFITEPNLYRLVMKSQLPSATQFESWVFETVLPSLRKFGMYVNDEVLSNSELFKILLKELKNERAEKKVVALENEMLEQTIADYEPKIDYLESILKSDCVMTSTQIAADYGISACRLNKILHDQRIHRKVGGQWVLYLNYMEQGLTHSETVPINGSNRAFVVQTKWTQKGRLLIHEILSYLGYVAYYDAKVKFYQQNNGGE